MFQIDAKEAKFTLIEVFGRSALFTTERVNRATVPEGLHAYNMERRGESRARRERPVCIQL